MEVGKMDPSLLPALAWFAQVARLRSFTKAANEMNVSRAALSQTVKTLEQKLKIRLLHRTTREVSLTEEGRLLLDAVAPALAAIESAVVALDEVQERPSGLLRINTSRLAAKTLIEPHLGELTERYPHLRLELEMDDGLSSIVASGCDAGIRLGESLCPNMIAVPISPMLKMAVVGSPAYFLRHKTPAAPADLAQHNCVCFRQTTSGAIYRWEFTEPSDSNRTFSFEPSGTFTTNDDDGMIRAALQGVGLIQHVDIAVLRYISDGSLLRVLEPWSDTFPGFYLYAPSREQMPLKLRVLIDFLVAKREELAKWSAPRRRSM
jgi:DNA-binding transcriptional LysR family regulator